MLQEKKPEVSEEYVADSPLHVSESEDNAEDSGSPPRHEDHVEVPVSPRLVTQAAVEEEVTFPKIELPKAAISREIPKAYLFADGVCYWLVHVVKLLVQVPPWKKKGKSWTPCCRPLGDACHFYFF